MKKRSETIQQFTLPNPLFFLVTAAVEYTTGTALHQGE
jgi:hypothetical protein